LRDDHVLAVEAVEAWLSMRAARTSLGGAVGSAGVSGPGCGAGCEVTGAGVPCLPSLREIDDHALEPLDEDWPDALVAELREEAADQPVDAESVDSLDTALCMLSARVVSGLAWVCAEAPLASEEVEPRRAASIISASLLVPARGAASGRAAASWRLSASAVSGCRVRPGREEVRVLSTGAGVAVAAGPVASPRLRRPSPSAALSTCLESVVRGFGDDGSFTALSLGRERASPDAPILSGTQVGQGAWSEAGCAYPKAVRGRGRRPRRAAAHNPAVRAARSLRRPSKDFP